MTRSLPYFLAISLLLMYCGRKDAEGPSPALSPEDELETFQIPDGLKIELVASEPMIEDPVISVFDEDGRLWVVEMRGFMEDVDGSGERDKVGRVSILQDNDGDGKMDKSTIYLDSLVMPRALAIVPGGALVVEHESLWYTQDTDGDLRSDKKTLIDSTYAGSKLPEHSGNGLWRGIDNWYYNAKSSLRYRLAGTEWWRDSTEFRGQWGISMDDGGRLFYNYNWSQLHADLVPPNYLFRNPHHTPTTGIDHGLTIDRRVYPIRDNPAVNRGYIPGTLDANGRLLEFTAACSPFVYRGTALGKDYRGNAFVCEPSGNLVKRNVVQRDSITLSAYDPNPGTEFLASTDERFRPVNLFSGPDGALYVTDMYRGLVQHKAYVTPYLREQTIARKLEKPINRGRIWRIVPEDFEHKKPVKLSMVSSEELVAGLSSRDGWQRDMAQKLLVERSDQSIAKLIFPVLQSENTLARLHALWTLEGLFIRSPRPYMRHMPDFNVDVRAAAFRIIERIARDDDRTKFLLTKALLDQSEHAPIDFVLQVALSASVLDPDDRLQTLQFTITRFHDSPLMRDAVMSSITNYELALLERLLSSDQWTNTQPSKEIFMEMLSSAILRKGDPKEIDKVLALTSKPGWKEDAILTALTVQANNKIKPIRLSAEPAVLKKENTRLTEENKNSLKSIFEWPGHKLEVSTNVGAGVLSDDARARFAEGRQLYLATCSACHGTNGKGMNRLAPTLVNSEWVTGDEKRLALIVLHGIEGPLEVAGKKYNVPEILPVMPSHSTMDDGALTSILIYIRNEWGNHAGAIDNRIVGRTRHTTQGRVVPWTATELNEHIKNLPKTENK